MMNLINRITKKINLFIFGKRSSILFSFLIALCICIVNDYDQIKVNLFNNTITTITVSDIPISVINGEAFETEGIPSTVSIILTGDETEIQTYRQQNKLEIIIDLKNKEEGEIPIDLSLSVPQSIEAKVEPSIITIKLKKKISRQFNFTYKINGNYDQIKEFIFDNDKIAITGSNDTLDEIVFVEAIAQIHDGETEGNAKIVAYDKNGNKINAKIDPSEIHFVLKKQKK